MDVTEQIQHILIKQHIGHLNVTFLQNKLWGQFILRLDCGANELFMLC